MVGVLHSCSDIAVAFVDTRSQYYLDCAISNDDKVIKELLDSDSDSARTINYLPLHKAAKAGCLNTAQTLFNLLGNPAQIDQNSRTPLHLAGLGGSTKIIRLLLGNDYCDGYRRSVGVLLGAHLVRYIERPQRNGAYSTMIQRISGDRTYPREDTFTPRGGDRQLSFSANTSPTSGTCPCSGPQEIYAAPKCGQGGTGERHQITP